MDRYSIRDLEQLTGIKAHTIRMWEKRYNFIEPSRTSTNIRYYSETDLKRFMNIALLNKHGHKISNLVKISPVEINKLVNRETENHSSFSTIIDSLIVPILELDEKNFDHIFSVAVSQYGFEETISSIMFPLMERVGYLWQTGSLLTLHEQFVNHLIQIHLVLAIANLHHSAKSASTVLLFLPEYENRELTLLFIRYLLKKSGFNVIYLGQRVPLEDLSRLPKSLEPEYLGTYLTVSPTINLNSYLKSISEIFNNKPFVVAGPQVEFLEIEHAENIFLFKTVDQLVGFFKNLS